MNYKNHRKRVGENGHNHPHKYPLTWWPESALHSSLILNDDIIYDYFMDEKIERPTYTCWTT